LEKRSEPLKQTLVPLRRNGTENSEEPVGRKNNEET